MIEHMLHHRIPREIVLYWGARAKRDLYLPDSSAADGRRRTRTSRSFPVLSEPAADDAWPGRTGFVHQAVLDDFRDLSGYQVYACGAPAMIDAARRDFTTLRGCPPTEFFADSFTYAAETEQARRRSAQLRAASRSRRRSAALELRERQPQARRRNAHRLPSRRSSFASISPSATCARQ